jgi:methionyl-tRNA formyltransferase
MNIVTYLLPLSGNILLKNLFEIDFISVKAAFIPETYVNDCEASINLLKSREIPYCVPSSFDEQVQEWLEKFTLDLGLSVGYDKQLPLSVFAYPHHGTVNLHPSLLPRYRGANPYFWVLKNQENETGVTLHYMDEGLDTGNIIQQKSKRIEPKTTMGELFMDLNTTGIEMMMDLLKRLKSENKAPSGHPQENSGNFPKAPKLNERDLRIDWDSTYDSIEAHVRAGNPHFGTYTTFKGNQIRIFEVSYRDDQSDETEIQTATIRRTEAGPIVKCRDGWVQLDLVQVDQRYMASGGEFQRREEQALAILDKVI